MKKILSLILLFFSLFIITSCNKSLKVENLAISGDDEFGGIFIEKTIEDFNKLGFKYGDSVNIKFSNGYELKDQPYYNGYYVDANNSLLVGYPGYPWIKAAINYGEDLFEIAGLNEDDTATITLNKKGKYLKIQEASDIHYYDEREKYDSDTIFANFRAMNVGNIKDNILFRSASPCDNKHKRAAYTDELMKENNIQFIMNLADTDEKIQSYIDSPDFNSPYFLSLYKNKKLLLSFANDKSVMPLALNMNYMSEDFAKKVAVGVAAIGDSDGPYLVHCLEGKDRTGFVCIVLEALMSATYQEIVDDYMLTYSNYYHIDIKDPRYNIIKARNVDAMLNFISDGADYRSGDLSQYAKNYLKFGGLDDAKIDAVINKLKK